MTFLQLQDDTIERCNLPETARSRVKRNLNEWYRRVTSGLGLGKGRDASSVTIVLVAGTAEYSVTAQKIKAIRDTTNQFFLEERTLNYIRKVDPGDVSSGVPEIYAIHKQSNTTLTVWLFPIPSAVNTLKVDTTAAVTDMAADGDLPTLIPEDYHWLLSAGARANEYEKADDSRFTVLRAEIAAGMRDLRYFMRKSHTQISMQHQIPETLRYSRLGSWFPAD